MRPHLYPASPRGTASIFYHSCIHLEVSQGSKSCEHSQLWISGKQVFSHFIFYKSKRTPGLGMRTMPQEWLVIHVVSCALSCICTHASVRRWTLPCVGFKGKKKNPSCLDMEYEMSSNALNSQVVCKYEVATLRLMSVGARSLSGRLQLCPSSYTLAYLPWIPCNCSRKKKERLFRRRSHACLRACATSNNNNIVISFF